MESVGGFRICPDREHSDTSSRWPRSSSSCTLLHVPVWCAERVWLALLLTIGAWGVVRLAEALGIGKRWARLLGALAYCVAPLVVDWAACVGGFAGQSFSYLGCCSPLVVGSKTGSPRRAAAKSGVAIALNGGRQCHRHPLRASACGHMAIDAGAWASSQVVDWMVGHMCSPGLLLVDCRDPPSRKIRIQLPSIYRDRHGDHIHRFCLRRSSWHIVLAELRRRRRTSHSWRMDPRHVLGRHCGDNIGHRTWSRGIKSANPRKTLFGNCT